MTASRRRTLLLLLGLGLALHAGRLLLDRVAARPAPELELGAAAREALRAEAAAALGRPPRADELAALVEEAVAEEILYREALARGLDREDEVVRRRLAANAAFLRGEPGAERERADELYREAVALGMDRTDVVVRRRLVQRVQMEIAAPARSREPGPEELRAWHDANRSRFEAPARVAFRHVFFDPALRGDEAARDAAERALAALRRSGEAAGDPCLVRAAEPLQPEPWIARLLGPSFAAALRDPPTGDWLGPVRSSLGWHAVRIEGREPARILALDEVRGEVRDALLAERGTDAVRRFVSERRPRP